MDTMDGLPLLGRVRSLLTLHASGRLMTLTELWHLGGR